MRVRVAFTEAAQEERREAVRFYRAANAEAARSFSREFKHELALLKARPELGTQYLEGTRRKVFPYFTYSVVYTLEENLITVHAVPHHSRDPEYWLDRIRHRRGG
ncbi:MAG: type II toxin-antitoxin system RelE/ParE family toxin [Gemmatimonadetes bacterium]|nr:type II toxin-antitoxin system RelE/ParE family toxin [Gemmatimonadota bacterium]